MGEIVAENPYTVGPPIRSEPDFFGRQQSRSVIWERVHEGQSIWVFGERRIGKTSLLLSLNWSRPKPAARFQVRICQLNAQFVAGCSEAEVERYLFDEMIAVLDGNSRHLDRMEMARLLGARAASGELLVAAIDEFDVLARAPAISERFLGWLRAVSIQKHLAVVVTSLDPPPYETFRGALLNHFFLHRYRLGVFSETDALELVQTPAKTQGVPFTEEETLWILEHAGYYPFLLQMAASLFFERKIRGISPLESVGSVRGDLEREADWYLRYLLERISTASQQALRRWLARGEKMREENIEELETIGILVGADRRLFSPLFRRHLGVA